VPGRPLHHSVGSPPLSQTVQFHTFLILHFLVSSIILDLDLPASSPPRSLLRLAAGSLRLSVVPTSRPQRRQHCSSLSGRLCLLLLFGKLKWASCRQVWEAQDGSGVLRDMRPQLLPEDLSQLLHSPPWTHPQRSLHFMPLFCF